jgi:hypothetical protein
MINRMYNHMLPDEMDVADFSLEKDTSRPNKIISSVFINTINYIKGDITVIGSDDVLTKPHEFHARAYINLLRSPGRNEPDDRICSIEVVIGEPVELSGNLKAIVVPHTLWDSKNRAPWLCNLNNAGVTVAPYIFTPSRGPEYYHTLLESVVFELYQSWGQGCSTLSTESVMQQVSTN